MNRLTVKHLSPLFALVFLAGCSEGGVEGTGTGMSESPVYSYAPPVFEALEVLPSNDDLPSFSPPLEGLDSCAPRFSGQSLLCGTVTTNDSVTPVAGVEVRLERDTSSRSKISSRGIADEGHCLTDSQGEYACIIPTDVSGIQTVLLLPPSTTDFEPAIFQVNIIAGETTTFHPQVSFNDQLEPIVFSDSVSPEPPLLVAVFSQSLEGVRELIAQGEDPNTARESDRTTPLIVAAQFGYTEIIEMLIDGGANPNQGSFSFTPLMVAAQNGHLDTVTLLLERGASVRVATDSNWTVLHSAVSNNREKLTTVLIDAGVPLDVQVRGYSPIAFAAQSGYTVLIDLLLNAGANPLGSPSNGPSPLTLAAQNRHSQAAERLIMGSADPDNGGIGDAPLVTAAASGSTDVLEVLVLGGATVDIRSSQNDWTGLMWAANNNDVETVRELLRLGADRTLRDPSGETAREIAEALGHSEVADLLS